MKKQFLFISVLFVALCSKAQQNDWSNVENVFGKKGTVTSDVFKITYPRSDLTVKVGDFPVAPGLALTSWVGIIKMGDEAIMIGDLVLLDSEVPKVINKLV